MVCNVSRNLLPPRKIKNTHLATRKCKKRREKQIAVQEVFLASKAVPVCFLGVCRGKRDSGDKGKSTKRKLEDSRGSNTGSATLRSESEECHPLGAGFLRKHTSVQEVITWRLRWSTSPNICGTPSHTRGTRRPEKFSPSFSRRARDLAR